MADKNAKPSAITQGCTNFRNYLRDDLKVENFQEFIFTYSFPLEEIEDLKKKAQAAGKEPVSIRLYYGCNQDGSNHKLHMSLLDKNLEVIVDSTELTNELHNFAMPAGIAVAAERKCPPGGTINDRLVSDVF
ncbi:hypothetical protein [Adhaeribacter radiodurans]|uniref:Uncharacterized protein n=1 Tax=Adhaeribacter radiodurans TaxID=2745197 RepID=A0A7L7L2L2_9BACT|nr:hypothetical protein [Adhaeribacter radiodurans]QMU26835.1 hypothetical protein HUW48_01760 [Adhaeribacter radiodurans]